MLLVTLHINVYQTASNTAQVNLLDENNHLGIPMMIFLPFSFSPPMASILTQMYFPEKKKMSWGNRIQYSLLLLETIQAFKQYILCIL